MKIRESCLQTGNLGYKTGLSFTNWESWVTKGILGLLFTKLFGGIFSIMKKCIAIVRTFAYNRNRYKYDSQKGDDLYGYKVSKFIRKN